MGRMASGKENTKNTTKGKSHQANQEAAKDNTEQTKVLYKSSHLYLI